MHLTSRAQSTLQIRRRRGRAARLIIFSLLVYLIAPLYGLQVNDTEQYALRG